jgi:hypothetical protein
MTRKNRKKCKNNTQKCKKSAKKGTELRCKLKSCKAKMYQSVYGVSEGGSIRSNPRLFY